MKVSIEGNIGSGKSTVISRVLQEMRLPVFLEPIEEWSEWLKLFYSDTSRWGMSFNLRVLLSFHKWKHNMFPAVYERSPLSNRHIFAQLQYEDGQMNTLEMDMYQTLYENLAWTPDAVIYIRTDPEVSMERMQKRARASEATVPLEYLRALHKKYDALFYQTQHVDTTKTIQNHTCNVYVVDGNADADTVYKEVSCLLKTLIQNK